MLIRNFTFQCNSSYSNTSQNAMFFMLTQLMHSVNITVADTAFYGLHNTSILYYYGESCGADIWNTVLFKNCKIHNNVGKQIKQMFTMLINNNGHIFSSIINKTKCDRHYNIIKFDYCTFKTILIFHIVILSSYQYHVL